MLSSDLSSAQDVYSKNGKVVHRAAVEAHVRELVDKYGFRLRLQKYSRIRKTKSNRPRTWNEVMTPGHSPTSLRISRSIGSQLYSGRSKAALRSHKGAYRLEMGTPRKNARDAQHVYLAGRRTA